MENLENMNVGDEQFWKLIRESLENLNSRLKKLHGKFETEFRMMDAKESVYESLKNYDIRNWYN